MTNNTCSHFADQGEVQASKRFSPYSRKSRGYSSPATRHPVAPSLGLGYPRYGDEFEIVGVPEEHFVHYAGEGTLDPSNLPPKHSA